MQAISKSSFGFYKIKPILVYLSIIISSFIIYEILLKETSTVLSKCVLFCFISFSVFLYMFARKDSITINDLRINLVIELFWEKLFSRRYGINYIIGFCLFPLLFISSICIITLNIHNIYFLFSYLSDNYIIIFILLAVLLALFSNYVAGTFRILVANSIFPGEVFKCMLYFIIPSFIIFLLIWGMVGIELFTIFLTFSVIFYCVFSYVSYITAKKIRKHALVKQYQYISDSKFFKYTRFNDVLKLYRNNQYREANNLLNNIVNIEEDNTWPLFYVYVGRLYWKIGNIDNAILFTRKALEKHDSCPRALKSFIDCLFDDTLLNCRTNNDIRYNDNIKNITQAIKKLESCSPKDFYPHIDYAKGCLFFLKGLKDDYSFSQAIKIYLKCVMSDVEQIKMVSRYYLAIILMIDKKSFLKSEYYLKQIQKHFKNNKEPGRLLRLVKFNLDRVTEAREKGIVFNKKIVFYCNDLYSPRIPNDCVSNGINEESNIKLVSSTESILFFEFTYALVKRIQYSIKRNIFVKRVAMD